MEFVAELSSRGEIPKSYFKMASTAGNGTGLTHHYAMAWSCKKQTLDVTGSTQDVASYGVDLSQVIFLYYGLVLNVKTIQGYRQVSGKKLLPAIETKISLDNGANGVSGILYSIMEQFDERENHGTVALKGRHKRK
ncbi:hypothetical protein DAPPUDRAFT_108258 [Daphnia pulex]|uniref:Uncharacterized protein n=1 Tax=Daphnia pulex TaxID=6669 RepID=E9GZM0_DAPPU|nr:hypothetical protein DAPPUDRAFT_108258 [Daphnia pulex]|eukprot:EFX75083.1 hypothetical protein DAPPUDRAFT_108258 [Daphnia pulex]